MSGGKSLSVQVTVPLWCVLYAIRYGQHRASYASTEAVELAERFWDVFPDWLRVQMLRDWDSQADRDVFPLGPPYTVGRRWDALRRRLEVGP